MKAFDDPDVILVTVHFSFLLPSFASSFQSPVVDGDIA